MTAATAEPRMPLAARELRRLLDAIGFAVAVAGITVIDGGCPCMFDPTADFGHKAMRFVFTLSRNVPRQV